LLERVFSHLEFTTLRANPPVLSVCETLGKESKLDEKKSKHIGLGGFSAL